jgi:hypothetical protein
LGNTVEGQFYPRKGLTTENATILDVEELARARFSAKGRKFMPLDRNFFFKSPGWQAGLASLLRELQPWPGLRMASFAARATEYPQVSTSKPEQLCFGVFALTPSAISR